MEWNGRETVKEISVGREKREGWRGEKKHVDRCR